MKISNLDFIEDIKVESVSGGRGRKGGNGSRVKGSIEGDTSTKWSYRVELGDRITKKEGMGNTNFELNDPNAKRVKLSLHVEAYHNASV